MPALIQALSVDIWKRRVKKKHTYACNQCNYASIRAGHLRKHLKTFNLQLLYFHSFKILGQIQQIRDILLSPPPSLAIWLKDGWISIQPFWGTWWEIQPIPDGIFIRWMDFHLMVGIPSTLVRFPTTWMEIHPLGLVGPDVAVMGQLPKLPQHFRLGRKSGGVGEEHQTLRMLMLKIEMF